jgi:hypothetical protein
MCLNLSTSPSEEENALWRLQTGNGLWPLLERHIACFVEMGRFGDLPEGSIRGKESRKRMETSWTFKTDWQWTERGRGRTEVICGIQRRT